MAVLMTIIWILLGLIILLIALLLVPFNFSGQAGLEETASFEGMLTWASGLLGFQATAAGGQPASVRLRLGPWSRQTHWGETKKPERRLKKFDFSWLQKAKPFLDQDVLKEVFRCLFRLERSLDLRLRFEGEIGFGDPNLTGYLAGLLAALNTGQWECNLQPNFTEEVLHFQGSVQGRVIPARMLWLTGRLLLSNPVRSIWWSQLRKFRTKNNDQQKEVLVND